jgi:hypothetical protein
MKTLLAAAAFALPLAVSTAATADDKTACLDAAAKGQTARDAHKLLDAREAFLVCARQVCPGVVKSDCAIWLAEVEKALPTIVLAAKDKAGTDLVEVTVTIDGRAVARKLDGAALPVDPGPHRVHFEAANGTNAEQEIVVREGERARAISALLAAAPAPEVKPLDLPLPAATSGTSGLRVAGLVVGGVGVVGLIVGAVGGGMAVSDKGSAQCVNNACQAGPLASAKTAAKVADAGLIAGGLLAAGGVVMFVIGRSGGEASPGDTAMTAWVAPYRGPSGGGLALMGSFR